MVWHRRRLSEKQDPRRVVPFFRLRIFHIYAFNELVFCQVFLIGIMNSSFARDFLLANRRSNLNLYPDDWKKLPIPDVSLEVQTPVIELVDKILAAKQKGFERKVSRFEKKLDKEVSALYGVEDTESNE